MFFVSEDKSSTVFLHIYWNLITGLAFYWRNTCFQVCREWESTALRVNKDVRLVRIRIGVVLGKDGGALGLISSF